MKLPDVNVLVYAINLDDERHPRSAAWLAGALAGTEAVGFAWVALLGVLRLTTAPQALRSPLAVTDAEQVISAWLSAPAAVIVEPAENHAARVCRLLDAAGRRGADVTDAHLAALASEHDADIVSFDRDLDDYPGVRRLEP